jgi:hypothetical protein
LLTARSVLLQSQHVRAFAGDIANALNVRLRQLWHKADNAIGKEIDDGVTDFQPKRRALLFHMAAMMDVNECALDWLPTAEREPYYEQLCHALALNNAQLAFSSDGVVQTAAEVQLSALLLKRTHANLLAQLNKANRQNVDAALNWWRAVEANPLANIDAARFIMSARAFLAMPASSASAERLFSDAGNVENAKRHNQSVAVLDMMLILRGWVRSELQARDSDSSGLANTREAYAELVRRVCRKVMELELVVD